MSEWSTGNLICDDIRDFNHLSAEAKVPLYERLLAAVVSLMIQVAMQTRMAMRTSARISK
eukprot:CAMPEP_0171078264 /NCGR_PEP_ID=MMETSP0766_2-20121228/14542_1 /TAXON_ID=439317 /ORGANISM="Gambierdiscus australes, Strain CAWD 149" /LENGTH=59 /DNA_ID=CAMNT_0011535381 /DNA_START=841 /DNA_END=1020 /DNA_ORIENTATION=-